MRVVVANPPRINEIDAMFGVKGKRVYFAWGDVIYNPMALEIPRHLIAHEEIHGHRQKQVGVDKWWDRYLAENMFRFEEELLAHVEECRVLAMMNGNGRNARRIALVQTAVRLANNSLYKWDPPLGASKAKNLLRTMIEKTA